MPKLDLDAIPQTQRTGYPPPYDRAVAGRRYRRLAPAAGLRAFGVSHIVLEPGAWSSQRHWHAGEDEFLVMLSGEAVLVDDAGEQVLGPGDCAAFPMNDGNGHHLENRNGEPCVFVVVGGGEAVGADYPDIDLGFTPDGRYVRKDGSEYERTRV